MLCTRGVPLTHGIIYRLPAACCQRAFAAGDSDGFVGFGAPLGSIPAIAPPSGPPTATTFLFRIPISASAAKLFSALLGGRSPAAQIACAKGRAHQHGSMPSPPL